MATFTELMILREEERVLMKIASKLNDQLNRLKVLYFIFVSFLLIAFCLKCFITVSWAYFILHTVLYNNIINNNNKYDLLIYLGLY